MTPNPADAAGFYKNVAHTIPGTAQALGISVSGERKLKHRRKSRRRNKSRRHRK